VDNTLAPRGWWGSHLSPPQPRSIVELIRAGTIDAELAAIVWLLVEARVPLIVAAERSRTGKSTLLEALLEFLPPGAIRRELDGVAETFDWLPHAAELGWRQASRGGGPTVAERPADPAATWLIARELSDHLPTYVWGDTARVALRAISLGYGLAATIHADSLEEVFDALHRPPVALTDDELTRLGVVLILRAYPPAPGDVEAGPARRVVAAHYVRPLARDANGHVQRLSPAVLATWDETEDEFEHFGWGILPELAERAARRPGDFEQELERRRDYLDGLAAADVVDVDRVRIAIDGYRATAAVPAHPN
jgi:hypothetical protein